MENDAQKTLNNKSITRAEFLKLGGAAAALGAATLAWHEGAADKILAALPANQAKGQEALVKTACALCPSGCGLEVRVVDGKAVKVEGDPLHPLNQGVCCLRGQLALEMLYSPERLEHPRLQRGKRGSGDWQEIAWDEALDIVAKKLSELRAGGKPHSLALVHGDLRGQMRSLANRFMQAYGSPNLIGRESLGEAAARQVMFLTQGVNGLPVYDLNHASYVMTFGGNLLESSRNVIVNLGALAFMRRGRPQRGKLVAVHPRLTLTGVKADEWVPIRPGTYGALALGMANVMINSKLYQADFVRDYTFGFEDFTDADGKTHKGFKTLVLEEYTLERVSAMTGVAAEVIARLAGEFATNRPAVAVLPNEIGELNTGNSLYTAMAVHALNALVGSIDVKGGVLAQRFPNVADWPAYQPDGMTELGLKQARADGAGGRYPLAISAYQRLPAAMLGEADYPLEALVLLNANPVYDLAGDPRMLEAMEKAPFIVSIAHTLDDSAALADIVLPASFFMEAWGDDYMDGVGYAGVTLRRPVVEPVVDSRDPGNVLLALAKRIGDPLAQALPFDNYLEVVKHRLSGAPLDWDKLETNGFWAEMVYFYAQPGSQAWGNVVGRDRLSAPQDGRFDFFSRELAALFAALPDQDLACLPHFDLPASLEASSTQALEYPLLLVAGSLITSTQAWQGVVPTLQESLGLQGHVKWQSWVELNPQTAEALHLAAGDEVWVESTQERVRATVRTYPGIWPNAVFMPLGQGHHTLTRWGRFAPEAMLVGSNPNRLATPATEPINGQAVTGPVRVKISKV